jgi:DNA modification methylase
MLICGDARHLPLRDRCVDCVVTSPPYYGLRDYGNGAQIGLEASPDAYVASLVAVFREVRRVLKDGGTVWLNLGDSYCNAGSSRNGEGLDGTRRGGATGADGALGYMRRDIRHSLDGIKHKDLLGIPWMLAFALRADGWYLRSDIIWSKPNPMPESVTDRPTKAHEYLFLLAKSERYYYDADAIAEPVQLDTPYRYDRGRSEAHKWADGGDQTITRSLDHMAKRSGNKARKFGEERDRPGSHLGASIPWEGDTRNKRTVWTVATMPYSGAHFATFPEALVEPCILAGCPLGGLALDPFVGSGTVGAVAERLGRRWAGVDLSYQELAKERTAQRGFLWV